MDFQTTFTQLIINPSPTILLAILILLIILSSSSYLAFKNLPNVKRPPEAGGGWPVIGHLLVLAGPELPHVTLGALADKYGPIFTIRIGGQPALVVSSSDIAKELLTIHDVAVSFRPKVAFGRIMGYDYANFAFCPYNAYWRQLRKITSLELLSSRRLHLLNHIQASEVDGCIKELYQLWAKKNRTTETAGHVTVEMKERFGDLNLNVILRMVAGKRCSGGEEGKRVKAVMREFFRLSGLFLIGDAIPFLSWLDIGGHQMEMKKWAEELDRLAEEWLEEHRSKKKKKKEPREEENRASTQDFIHALLSVLKETDLDGYDVGTVIKATTTTLLAAGTDTTTVTVTWTLAALLNNPDTIEKAQRELDQHVGREKLVSISEMDKLVYLQAIVKESLRLYPAGPLSGPREFNEDCTVGGGYYVPKGTRLVLNLWKIQTDPSIWSDPLEFKPERFLGRYKDLDVNGQHFELIPFGGGRRSCPGISFGVQNTQLVIASLLQAFEVCRTTSELIDMTGSPGLTNFKANPLEILIKPRLPHHLYH